MEGVYSIGATVATSLNKLAVRFMEKESDKQKRIDFWAQSRLIIASILHLGRSGLPQKSIADHEADILERCLRVYF